MHPEQPGAPHKHTAQSQTAEVHQQLRRRLAAPRLDSKWIAILPCRLHVARATCQTISYSPKHTTKSPLLRRRVGEIMTEPRVGSSARFVLKANSTGSFFIGDLLGDVRRQSEAIDSMFAGVQCSSLLADLSGDSKRGRAEFTVLTDEVFNAYIKQAAPTATRDLVNPQQPVLRFYVEKVQQQQHQQASRVAGGATSQQRGTAFQQAAAAKLAGPLSKGISGLGGTQGVGSSEDIEALITARYGQFFSSPDIFHSFKKQWVSLARFQNHLTPAGDAVHDKIPDTIVSAVLKMAKKIPKGKHAAVDPVAACFLETWQKYGRETAIAAAAEAAEEHGLPVCSSRQAPLHHGFPEDELDCDFMVADDPTPMLDAYNRMKQQQQHRGTPAGRNIGGQQQQQMPHAPAAGFQQQHRGTPAGRNTGGQQQQQMPHAPAAGFQQQQQQQHRGTPAGPYAGGFQQQQQHMPDAHMPDASADVGPGATPGHYAGGWQQQQQHMPDASADVGPGFQQQHQRGAAHGPYAGGWQQQHHMPGAFADVGPGLQQQQQHCGATPGHYAGGWQQQQHHMPDASADVGPGFQQQHQRGAAHGPHAGGWQQQQHMPDASAGVGPGFQQQKQRGAAHGPHAGGWQQQQHMPDASADVGPGFQQQKQRGAAHGPHAGVFQQQQHMPDASADVGPGFQQQKQRGAAHGPHAGGFQQQQHMPDASADVGPGFQQQKQRGAAHGPYAGGWQQQQQQQQQMPTAPAADAGNQQQQQRSWQQQHGFAAQHQTAMVPSPTHLIAGNVLARVIRDDNSIINDVYVGNRAVTWGGHRTHRGRGFVSVTYDAGEGHIERFVVPPSCLRPLVTGWAPPAPPPPTPPPPGFSGPASSGGIGGGRSGHGVGRQDHGGPTEHVLTPTAAATGVPIVAAAAAAAKVPVQLAVPSVTATAPTVGAAAAEILGGMGATRHQEVGGIAPPPSTARAPGIAASEATAIGGVATSKVQIKADPEGARNPGEQQQDRQHQPQKGWEELESGVISILSQDSVV